MYLHIFIVSIFTYIFIVIAIMTVIMIENIVLIYIWVIFWLKATR